MHRNVLLIHESNQWFLCAHAFLVRLTQDSSIEENCNRE